MSQEHLATGSKCPPLIPGKLRIYAMRFCPFAQRALLVSAAKNIPTDVVYINLMDKPEWIFPKNPGGKVPTVELSDGKCIYESLIVADFLDEAYQGPKLHSADPFQKAVDKIWIENLGKLGPVNYKMLFLASTPAEDIPKLAEEYEAIVAEFSAELEKRGTKFFLGDDHPGIIDYAMWPWFERRPVLQMQHPNYDFSPLRKNCEAIEQWIKRMMEDPAVKMYYLTPEIHYQFNQTSRSGNPDYNILVK